MQNILAPLAFDLDLTGGPALSGTFQLFTIAMTLSGSGVKRFDLDGLDLAWDTESGSPTTVEWYTTYDSTGDQPSLPTKSSTAVAGQTASTGGVSESIEKHMVTDGNLYVWARFSDGTTPTANIALLRATIKPQA